MLNSQFLIQKNKNLNKEEVVQSIFEFVDSNIDISKYHRYRLNDDMDLTSLALTEYFVQPLHMGEERLLVIKKFDDNYYSVYVPFKDESTRIIASGIKSHKNTYDGTIFQGIFDGTTYWITDVYLLSGVNIQSHKLEIKFLNLKEFIDNYFHNSGIKVALNKLYPLKKIGECIESAKKSNIVGLLFTPQMPFVNQRIVSEGIIENVKQYYHKYFYLFSNKNEIYNVQSLEFGDSVKNTKVLTMQKTKVADVYKLLEKKKQIGIAYVANMEYSILYSKWFKENTELTVLCKWNAEFKKWCPMKIENISN